MKNIVVLVSGGGTNLQALIDASERGEIKGGKITCVISSNPNAYALERAKNHNIATDIIRRKDYASLDEYDKALTELLKSKNADLVVLAGFMTILGTGVIRAFENRIINIHPSLIPSFCGEGFYGLKVHEQALARGVKVKGATAQFVTAVLSSFRKLLKFKTATHPKFYRKELWNRRSGKFFLRLFRFSAKIK